LGKKWKKGSAPAVVGRRTEPEIKNPLRVFRLKQQVGRGGDEKGEGRFCGATLGKEEKNTQE